MTNRKTRTQQVLDNAETPAAGTRPYLDESSEFRTFLTRKRKGALHDAEELQTEVETLEVQIQARLTLLNEKRDIIARCDAALEVTVAETNGRQAPAITKKVDRAEQLYNNTVATSEGSDA